MEKCLILIDLEHTKNAIELLEVAKQMYDRTPYESYALCIGTIPESVVGPFNHIVHVSDDTVDWFNARIVTNIMEALHQVHDFSSILIPATQLGRMVAPRLAMRLHVGLVADVTAIEHVDGSLQMVRPAFSGKIMACISNMGKKPVMMSVRQNVFSYEGTMDKNTVIESYKPFCAVQGGIKRLGKEEKPKSKDIRDSDVLVSGGGGVKRHFQRLSELADLLDGEVSASRQIVDSGIASRRIQVGQSGKTVSPKLYLALGIYGSLQHIEGLKNVKHIISVNTNKDAPICSLSDIVVEGDAVEFIEKLVEKIRKERL